MHCKTTILLYRASVSKGAHDRGQDVRGARLHGLSAWVRGYVCILHPLEVAR